jgi:hypothetical protein
LFLLLLLVATGKSITAKQICNELDVPVIVVDRRYSGLASFLGRITQDLTILFDEYEKTFGCSSDHETEILSLLDGVHNMRHARNFILTINTYSISDNLIQRPSRIRYRKHYEGLTTGAIQQIVKDRLTRLHHREATLGKLMCVLLFVSPFETEFFAFMRMLTMDLVCSIIDEVNESDEAPKAFESIFNARPAFARTGANMYRANI